MGDPKPKMKNETNVKEGQPKEIQNKIDNKNVDNEKKNKEEKNIKIVSKSASQTKPKQVTAPSPTETLLLTRLINEFSEVSRELKQLNKRIDMIVEANEKPLELEESVESLTKSIVELKTSINSFNTKLDTMIRQINIQMSKWDIIMNEIKRLVNTLRLSVEEINEYIKNPLFEDIEDEITLRVALFLYHYRLLGYTDFPEEVIMIKLGITAEELQRAIEELKAKGWNIEVITYEEE